MARKGDERAIGRRRSLGQAVVEMALIAPLFILICFGILDLGRAFYSYERIQNAAREGAMWISQGHASGVQQRVQSEGIQCAGGQNVLVTSSAVSNGQVTVAVSCAFNLVTPFMQAILSSTPPCRTLMGITFCTPSSQPIILRGSATMPMVWTG